MSTFGSKTLKAAVWTRPARFNPRRQIHDLVWDMVSAIADDDVTRLKQFLNRGYSPNARNIYGETAFSYCCANNSIECARLLHSRGADFNSIDHGNGSCLDWAHQWSSPEFEAWLVSIGGRFNEGGPDVTRFWKPDTDKRDF